MTIYNYASLDDSVDGQTFSVAPWGDVRLRQLAETSGNIWLCSDIVVKEASHHKIR